jgi:Ca-activated chloride channel family protein
MPKLWAARKVGVLAQRLKLEGRNRELLDELRETALRYGIVSEYTSYLVLEEDAQIPRDRAVAGRAAGGAVPPTIASAPVTGQGAVMKAESMRRAREARSSADLAHAEEAMQAANTSSTKMRSAGGRSFEERNGVWTDAALKKNLAVVEVEPYSSAYFTVLRALPELEAVWKAMPASVTAGKRVAIGVKAGGKKQLSRAELASLVQRFRS